MNAGRTAEAIEESRKLARFLIEHGHYDDKETKLGELLEMNPRDERTVDELVTVFIRIHDFRPAGRPD